MENIENNQDSGLELLKKVIETNEKNIEQGVNVVFFYEDLLNLIGETESSLRSLSFANQKLLESQGKEQQKREEFLEQIPKTLDVQFTEESKSQLRIFERKSKGIKYLVFGSIGILLLSAIMLFITSVLAENWYSESVKTKTEIRTEIFNEIEKEGKTIYKTTDLEQLKHNTLLMKKWMQKYPKDSEKFLRFKEGFEVSIKR